MEERNKQNENSDENAKEERRSLETFLYMSVSSTHFLTYRDYKIKLHTP
jgi:hypothetical protein